MNDNFYSLEYGVWRYYQRQFTPDEVWDALINLRDEENQ
jgi:hypothetical protein